MAGKKGATSIKSSKRTRKGSNRLKNIIPQLSKNIETKSVGSQLKKIIIRCEPLNIEKVVCLKNNKSIYKSPTELPATKSSKVVNKTKLFATQSKNLRNSKEPSKNVSKLVKCRSTECKLDKSSNQLINQALSYENGSANNQFKNMKQLTVQTRIIENVKQEFYFKTTGSESQEMSSVSNSKGVDFDLNENHVEKLDVFLKKISSTELKQREISSHHDVDDSFNTQNSVIVSSRFDNANQDVSNATDTPQSFLLKAVKTFMKNPQLNLQGKTALKRGLCITYLSNNFICPDKKCTYNHNALKLFTKKLAQYSSRFIITIVVSMRSDVVFVDVIMAAFKIFSERNMPVVWITFLILFVFYVSEPSDSRFLKFWGFSARFFCQLHKNYAAANGFASLLSIFNQGDESEEWKIIEFIKVIKQVPIEVPTNYALLQPVLNLDLPTEFLIDAVQSCISTQEDILEVYFRIIPKIPIMTSPMSTVELLLKYTKILKERNNEFYAVDMKRKLRDKVLSVTIKISSSTYPLTAAFQEQLSTDSNFTLWNSLSDDSKAFEVLNAKPKYFQPGDDFWALMTQTMHLEDTNKIGSNLMDDVCERHIKRIKQFFCNYQFDLLGKYLNKLKPDVIEPASQIFIELLFKMKISLRQAVDLVKIIIFSCKSETAAKISANIALTIIINLIKINQWEKAHAIVSFCRERQVDIIYGKVCHCSELSAITQCRILLLLIEIYAYKNDFTKAMELIRKYYLYLHSSYFWGVCSDASDEIVRVRILEGFLQQIINEQFNDGAYELFDLIWKEQNQLSGLIDLRKFANDILILLLNQNEEDAIVFYEKIAAEISLNDITTRAIVVTLVRHNRQSTAKSIVLSDKQSVFLLPKISCDFTTVLVKSFWLEEEIYVFFDAFFDVLAAEAKKFVTDFVFTKIYIQLSDSYNTQKSLRPLCLGIINTCFEDACCRIHRVLQYQFNPPIELIIQPQCIKLDELSVKFHLQKRMKGNIC